MAQGSSGDCTPDAGRLLLWDGVLDRVRQQMTGACGLAAAPGAAATTTAARALARAYSHLLVALNASSNVAGDAVSELESDTAALLSGALALSAQYGGDAQGLGRAFDDALVARLGAHEHAVLAGEVTYGVRAEEADTAATRLRELIAAGPVQTPASHSALLSLRLAAVELAALLVRAAGNAVAGDHAEEAPEPRSPPLDRALRAITLKLAKRANAVRPPVDKRGDVAAHHLAAALRLQTSDGTQQALARVNAAGAAGPSLSAAREGWLALATYEYVAVVAIDDHLDVPTWQRFGTLTDAIVEGVANVVCGARLASRPAAFHHRSAGRHQTVALTYALEAYVAGLRGHSPSFEQAQLITLTRLIRAVAAITLLDLRHQARPSRNGHATPTRPTDRNEEN